MKIKLTFIESDKPEQMGLIQLPKTSEFEQFLEDRKDILVDYKIYKDYLTFVKPDNSIGKAFLEEVSDDYAI